MQQNTPTLLTEDQIREKVRERAYEIYRDRGGEHGSDLDDWLNAESQVLSDLAEQERISRVRKQPTPIPAQSMPQDQPSRTRGGRL